jgi:3',5'-nucleoside bisphosphate phosphatase
LKTLRAEFHVHSVLSPCAEVEMIPPLIVSKALESGIELIAITDHNATANIAAVQQAAQDTGLTVLPGMEITTREEVHSLCLFDMLDQAVAFQQVVDAAFPVRENDPEHFGEQFVVDHTGGFIRNETKMLAASCELSLRQAYQAVTELGGLFIPAHVDRRIFGLIATLGFVPRDVPFEALEISRLLPIDQAAVKYPELGRYPLIQSGDVHQLVDFLGVNELTLESCSLAEIRKALTGSEGRQLRILPQVT